MHKLLKRAGEELAKICEVEAAYITSGAGAAMVLASAACITGKDREKMDRLPDTEGMKNEIIIQRGNESGFTRLFRNAGAKLIDVGGSKVILQGYGTKLRALGVLPEDIEHAINENTCAIAHTISHLSVNVGTVPLEKVISIAHKHNLPVIVDAAAEIPPFENIHKFTDMGADLVVFSGGKSLHGPNDTGLLVGRKDLVEAASMQSSPNSGIGRPFKVSKEQIVGLVVAVNWYKEWFNDEITAQRRAKAEYMINQFKDFPHIETHLIFPDETGKPCPMVQLVLDEKALGIKALDVAKKLREQDPPIYIRGHYTNIGIITLNPLFLEDGEEKIVCERIKEILTNGNK
jgi:uncharacterized pyridoxal phosphate-dependent enzyme